MPTALSELEIGLVAIALTLLIFGVQGLISVSLEGRQLHYGRVQPRLTNPLSVAIIVFSLILFGLSIALGVAIVRGWEPWLIGTLSGLAAIDLSFILVFYKEAFVGDEGCFDEREDGVPW